MNFNLKYDFNALREIEDKSGLGITEIMESKKIMSTTRVMLWGGMLHINPNITVSEVGELIQNEIKEGKKIDDIMGIVVKALGKSGVMGVQEEKKEGTEGKN